MTSSVVSPCIMAKEDSAASSYYWREEDNKCLENIKKFKGPSVLLPNIFLIKAGRKVQLPLSEELFPQAQTAMKIPHLKSALLISTGQLCDNNCDVILNKSHLIGIKNNNIILEGTRDPYDKLWDIPIKKQNISPKTIKCQQFILQFTLYG